MSNVLRYGSAKLFASDSAQPNTLKALSLVNEINFGFDANRENIKSIGSQKTFKTFLEPPKPTVSFKYFISDLDNEKFFTMPTTSFQAYTLRTPIFTGLKPFDLAFVLDKKGRDFDKISVYDEVSVCLMTNCVLTNYSFSVNKNAVTQVSVQFQGDNIIFKNFKNILDYDDLIYDSTDLQMTNRLDFQINDGTQEIVENIGGAKAFQSEPAITVKKRGLIVRSNEEVRQKQAKLQDIRGPRTVTGADGRPLKDFKRFRKNVFIPGSTSPIRFRSVLPRESERLRQLELAERELEKNEREAEELFHDRGGVYEASLEPRQRRGCAA